MDTNRDFQGATEKKRDLKDVKSKPHPVAEPDSFTTGNESALQSPAAEHPDVRRSTRTKAVAPVDSKYHGHSISGIVDVVLEVGRQRNTLLAQLRIALESGEERIALNLAKRLCGLPHEEGD